MITYTHKDYENRLETHYTVEYIDNEKDMDYVQSGKIDNGEPSEHYKKRSYDCIDNAMSFYMVSLFNPKMFDVKFFEEILLDGETIRESHIEPKSVIGNTLKQVINKSMYEDIHRANNEIEALEKKLYLVNKWFTECKPAENTFNDFVRDSVFSGGKLTVYRYYSLLRPVGPGTYPKPSEAKNIVNFDERTFIDDINRYAWGYIEYEKELSWDEARAYDLEWNRYTKMDF